MINLTNKLDDLRDEARTKDENLNQAQDQISEANQRAETSRNEIQNLQGRRDRLLEEKRGRERKLKELKAHVEQTTATVMLKYVRLR